MSNISDYADIDRLPLMKGIRRSGIYCILNISTKYCYIGQSINIHERYNSHRRGLKAGNHRNKRLLEEYQNNKDNFLYLVLEECNVDLLNDREQHWLDLIVNKYNEILFSDRRTFSEEHRRKLSISHLGNKHTEKAKLKIGEASKGNTYRKGQKWTPEERLIHSLTANHIIKNGYHPMRGKKRNPEAIKKAVETRKKNHPGLLFNTREVIKVSDTGVVIKSYPMVKDALFDNKISRQTFSRLVNGNTKLFEKYRLKYSD